jgi:hypothetical protein
MNSTTSRKILIIGSSYKRDERRTATMFSIITLDGALEDKKQLREVFTERTYSVETLFNTTFTREDVLLRVAQFVRNAESGDVRAIAFTGHAYRTEDGTVMLIPPHCPSRKMAIPQTDWDQNICDNTKSGVIVLSIMAHCFSGDFMKQGLDHRDWDSAALDPDIKTEQPIYITFSSTSSDQSAYESAVERNNPGCVLDHFVHALVKAMRDPNSKTWVDFFTAFKVYFEQARSCASWVDKTELRENKTIAAGWRLNNRQEPCFSASENVVSRSLGEIVTQLTMVGQPYSRLLFRPE